MELIAGFLLKLKMSSSTHHHHKLKVYKSVFVFIQKSNIHTASKDIIQSDSSQQKKMDNNNIPSSSNTNNHTDPNNNSIINNNNSRRRDWTKRSRDDTQYTSSSSNSGESLLSNNNNNTSTAASYHNDDNIVNNYASTTTTQQQQQETVDRENELELALIRNSEPVNQFHLSEDYRHQYINNNNNSNSNVIGGRQRRSATSATINMINSTTGRVQSSTNNDERYNNNNNSNNGNTNRRTSRYLQRRYFQQQQQQQNNSNNNHHLKRFDPISKKRFRSHCVDDEIENENWFLNTNNNNNNNRSNAKSPNIKSEDDALPAESRNVFSSFPSHSVSSSGDDESDVTNNNNNNNNNNNRRQQKVLMIEKKNRENYRDDLHDGILLRTKPKRPTCDNENTSNSNSHNLSKNNNNNNNISSSSIQDQIEDEDLPLSSSTSNWKNIHNNNNNNHQIVDEKRDIDTISERARDSFQKWTHGDEYLRGVSLRNIAISLHFPESTDPAFLILIWALNRQTEQTKKNFIRFTESSWVAAHVANSALTLRELIDAEWSRLAPKFVIRPAKDETFNLFFRFIFGTFLSQCHILVSSGGVSSPVKTPLMNVLMHRKTMMMTQNNNNNSNTDQNGDFIVVHSSLPTVNRRYENNNNQDDDSSNSFNQHQTNNNNNYNNVPTTTNVLIPNLPTISAISEVPLSPERKNGIYVINNNNNNNNNNEMMCRVSEDHAAGTNNNSNSTTSSSSSTSTATAATLALPMRWLPTPWARHLLFVIGTRLSPCVFGLLCSFLKSARQEYDGINFDHWQVFFMLARCAEQERLILEKELKRLQDVYLAKQRSYNNGKCFIDPLKSWIAVSREAYTNTKRSLRDITMMMNCDDDNKNNKKSSSLSSGGGELLKQDESVALFESSSNNEHHHQQEVAADILDEVDEFLLNNLENPEFVQDPSLWVTRVALRRAIGLQGQSGNCSHWPTMIDEFVVWMNENHHV